MKRVVLSIIAVAAALVTVSCNKEQAFDSGDIAKVTYTVAGPQMVATKAMGTIGSAYTLFYEVRLFDGSTLGGKLEGEGLSGSKTVGAAEWPATVQFDLARGKQYKILFWAQSASAPEDLFDASNLTAIAINYTKMAANKEECDAFSGFDVITPSGATAASATLHRPFALVNLGTSDAAQFKTASGNAEVGNVKVTVTGSLANSFNVATATAGAGVETSFESTAAKIDAYDAKTLTVNEVDFNYLSAVYVLPPAGEGIVNVAYEIKDNAENAITNLPVTNVPVKTNYRTNITGKLLTGSTTYNISVDQAFAGNTNKAVGPTFASVAALNEYFETLLDNADNGNIDPETVTLTAVGTLPTGMGTPTIYLPKVTENIRILMPVNDPALDLVISYASGASAEQKPANLYFYASNIKTLTADITSTHFELISGSIVNTEAVVSTSTGTFVIQQGAKVGTVKIQKGNANIAGEVTTVSVPSGATADGQNPVQVFLSKESAVDEIVLAAKSDVVVEQPKDHIAVGETEYKVAVYVNEGAANSTAKAQNGGVIYVKASVPCSVTADGVSETEEGSTVIINSGAAGSSVIATNGAAIGLTANGSCAAIAEGTSDENNNTGEGIVESTITVKEASADVNAVETSNGDVKPANNATQTTQEHINNTPGVAMIGSTVYASLAAAVAQVPDAAPTTITMIGNETILVNAGVTIPKEKIVILELNGKTISQVAPDAATGYLIKNNGTLTIQDNTDLSANGTGKGVVTGYAQQPDLRDIPGYATNLISNYGSLTILSGCFSETTQEGYAGFVVDNYSGATANISGGALSIAAPYSYAVRMFLNSTTADNVLNISGTAHISGTYSVWMQYANSKANKGTLNISGGTLDATQGRALYAGVGSDCIPDASEVSVNISGGIINGTGAWFNANTAFKSFTVSGGEFANFGVSAAGGNGFVTGGTYRSVNLFFSGARLEGNCEDNTIIAEGYKCVKDNDVYYVVPAGDSRETAPIDDMRPSNIVKYWWETSSGDQVRYYDIAEPFVKHWLCDGEHIDLVMNVTLVSDIICELASGDEYYMAFGNYTISGGVGGFHIILPTGVSVVTDKQTDIFTAADNDAHISVETLGDNTYKYMATTEAE